MEDAAPEPAPERAKPIERRVAATYEHPWVVRITHWFSAATIFVMVTSGLRIFRAFPSFGPKIPQHDLIDVPRALTLGGWLGGALQWHFTFMWIFLGAGVLYLLYQFLSGHYKTVLFMPRDIRGVWPMARHYFLFGPKPTCDRPIQSAAETGVHLDHTVRHRFGADRPGAL